MEITKEQGEALLDLINQGITLTAQKTKTLIALRSAIQRELSDDVTPTNGIAVHIGGSRFDDVTHAKCVDCGAAYALLIREGLIRQGSEVLCGACFGKVAGIAGTLGDKTARCRVCGEQDVLSLITFTDKPPICKRCFPRISPTQEARTSTPGNLIENGKQADNPHPLITWITARLAKTHWEYILGMADHGAITLNSNAGKLAVRKLRQCLGDDVKPRVSSLGDLPYDVLRWPDI